MLLLEPVQLRQDHSNPVAREPLQALRIPASGNIAGGPRAIDRDDAFCWCSLGAAPLAIAILRFIILEGRIHSPPTTRWHDAVRQVSATIGGPNPPWGEPNVGRRE